MNKESKLHGGEVYDPNVTVATAGHPILPELREKALQYNAPVHIGKNCRIGAGSVILSVDGGWISF